MNKRIALLIFAALFPALTYADTSYVVQRGDTLLKLADRLLGKNDAPERYAKMREIVAKNPDLKDPNILTPGQRLILPDAPPEVIAAAIGSSEANRVAAPAAPDEDSAPAVAPVASAASSVPVSPTPQVVEAEPLPAAEKAHIENHVSHANFFFIQPRYELSELEVEDKATHEHATVESELNAGLGVGYGKALGEKSHFVIAAGFDYVKMGGPGHGASISEATQTLKNFSLGWEYEVSHSFAIEVKAFYADTLFLLSNGVNAYKMKTVAVPGAELALYWSFWHLKASELGLSVGGEYASEVKDGDLTYASVLDPAYSLYWKTERYRLAVTYGMNEQAPTGFHHEATAVGAKLDLIFPL